jgi:hypothetical protein
MSGAKARVEASEIAGIGIDGSDGAGAGGGKSVSLTCLPASVQRRDAAA